MKKELKGKVVYLNNVPSFLVEGNKKEPVNPVGWQYYRDHMEEVDDWLVNSGRRARPSPSGQIPY